MSHLGAIIGPVSPVAWQPWQTAAFLDAQRRRRPILLLLETAWAPACAAAHATVFSRADVQQAVADTVVAVRVDADRRPDIADRYGLGHWPSVLVLTPEGLVVTGGCQLDDEFAPRLRRAVTAFADNDHAWRHGGPTSHDRPSRGDAPMDDEEALTQVASAVWEARDAESGAWLVDGRPCAACTLFGLAHAQVTGASDWHEAVAATIALQVDDLRNDGDSAAESPRRGLHPRLDHRAAWVTALARAVQLTRRDDWAAALDLSVHLVTDTFRRDDGTWRPWVGAGDLVLVDATALACRGLLAAADALEHPDRAREAIDGLERIAPAAYARGAGVSHVLEHDRPRGPMLLDDGMALAHALLDAQAWRTDAVYRDLGEELLRSSWARLITPAGALTDRVAALAGGGRVGRLADPWLPLAGNAWAARLLARLWPGDAGHAAEARGLLRAVTSAAVDAGPLGAGVGLAWHALGPAGRVVAAW
jgi:thioredoxin-like negative regulator of GroEL